MPTASNFSHRETAPVSPHPTQTRPVVRRHSPQSVSDAGRPAVALCGICRNLFEGPRDSSVRLVWAGVSDAVVARCCPACAIAVSGRLGDAVKDRARAFAVLDHAKSQCECGHTGDEHFSGWGTCLHVCRNEPSESYRNCECGAFTQNRAK